VVTNGILECNFLSKTRTVPGLRYQPIATRWNRTFGIPTLGTGRNEHLHHLKKITIGDGKRKKEGFTMGTVREGFTDGDGKRRGHLSGG
jgi:hypothetical protein